MPKRRQSAAANEPLTSKRRNLTNINKCRLGSRRRSAALEVALRCGQDLLPHTDRVLVRLTSHGLVASSTATDTEGSIVSLFIIAAAAAVAPLLASLTRKRVPDVVWLLILGIAVGPNALGFASLTEPISVFREVGMGMLFLIAGTEINVEEVHGRAGRRSLLTWLACFGIGLAVSWAAVAGVVYPPHLNMEQCSSEHTAEYNFDQDIEFIEDETYNSQIVARILE